MLRLWTGMMQIPPWSRLNSFISQFEFTRYVTLTLALQGFAVGLNLRLVGGDTTIANKIDGEVLLFSCIAMIAVLMMWIATETYFRIQVPNEIRHHVTVSHYLEKERNSVQHPDSWPLTFDEKVAQWAEKDTESWYGRTAIFFFLAFSLLLSLLSLVLLVISLRSLLRDIVRSLI